MIKFWKETIKIFMLLVLSTIMLANCSSPVLAQNLEKLNPYTICEKTADNWESKTNVYSVIAIHSAREVNGIYYCIVGAIEHRPEYDIPVTLKMTYNLEYDGLSVKRWGIFG